MTDKEKLEALQRAVRRLLETMEPPRSRKASAAWDALYKLVAL